MSVATAIFVGTLAVGCEGEREILVDRRDVPSFMRGPHNQAFFFRHNPSFSSQAAIHFAHGKAHDVGELTPLAEAPEQAGR